MKILAVFVHKFIKIMDECIFMVYKYDEKDVEILRFLCINAKLSSRKLAQKLGMHPNSVIERIKKMEKAGIIRKYTTLLNVKMLGYKIKALIQLEIKGNTDVVMKKIVKLPFIQNAYRTTGEYDGIVKVICRDMDDLGRIVNEMNGVEGVQKVNTKIVLAEFKEGGLEASAIF